MDGMHEANREYWDEPAAEWEQLRDQDERWRRCHQDPSLGFDGDALEMILTFIGDLTGKRVCVVGSGDNLAAFALAGMGAAVTSTDISEEQLAVAEKRASELGLELDFVRCDAADLAPLADDRFDLVCSTNGFFVWIANPEGVFSAVHRVLKEGGFHIFYDVHPFLRPWNDRRAPIEMEKPYFDAGPFVEEEPGGKVFEFHWTIGDILGGLLRAGLELRALAESPASDSRFWQDHSYLPGTDASLLDWQSNPRAGLPVWLTVAAQRPYAGRRDG
jgi:SAM-dependent methyltransferase